MWESAEQQATAESLCGDSYVCLFDFFATGDESIAGASNAAAAAFESAQAVLCKHDVYSNILRYLM